MDAELAGVVERRSAGSLRGVFNLCFIVVRSVAVRGVLRFLGGGLIKLGAYVFDVVVYCEAAGVLNIVSFEVDSSIEVAFLIDCYFRVFFEGVEKMISVAHDY